MSDEQKAKRRPSLRHNAAAQSAPVLAGYALSFLSAPLIVAGLGVDGFGIWAVTGALAQYGALLDLGVARAVSRYVASYEATNDRDAQGEVMAIAIGSMLALAIVLPAAGYLVARPLGSALGGISTSDMQVVVVFSTLTLSTMMLTRVVAAFAIGRQRMAAPNLGMVCNAVFTFLAVVISLQISPTLPVFAAANAGAALLGLVTTTALVINAEGPVPIRRPRAGRGLEIFSYSWKTQVGFVSDLIVFQSDKIILGLMVSPAAAGAYELGSRVAIAARSLAVIALTAILPNLTHDIAQRGFSAITDRYYALTTRAAAIGFAPLWLVISAAPALLVAWLDDVPDYTTAVAAALAFAAVFNVSSGVPGAAAQAAGNAGIIARAGVVTAVTNVILALALAPAFGVWGVLVATCVASGASGVVGVFLVHREFNLGYRRFLSAVAGPCGVALAASAPVAIFAYAVPLDGRAEAIAAAIPLTLVFAILYFVTSSKLGFLPLDFHRLRGKRVRDEQLEETEPSSAEVAATQVPVAAMDPESNGDR